MIDLSEINLRIRRNLKRYREVALDLELHNDTEENKQKTKTKTKFSDTKMRVLQKNIIILHLLVDSFHS